MSTPRSTAVTRLREKQRTDRAGLDALLDAVHVGHLGFVDDAGLPRVMPSAVLRDGDRLVTHGSTGSPWLRRLATGVPACVEVTAVDGIVVARSAFESSIRYRSAVLYGAFEPVPAAAKAAALDRVTDALLPGRRGEIRGHTDRELAATLVLAMPIATWSLKVSDAWPEDPPEDVAGPAWAGVVPVREVYGAALPAPDLRAGIRLPDSVRGLGSRGPVP
ncbi:MAG: pyridoxamine 5'-phosphate oxidase family protein [Jatrophihabitans sp.]|nr:MAG: pyridoxamine 5'-phosphate oxidase family protein [Jatrophihabitans sp.]